MIVSIYNEEVDNFDMKYIVNNFIKNGHVKLENDPRWGESKTDIWVQVPISLIYYRFIVRFTIGLEFLFITFLLQFFLVHMSSLSMSSSAIYSSTFSNHIYLLVGIILVHLKVVMHQGYVLSPLLFGFVMDVVPSDVVYLPSCCMVMT